VLIVGGGISGITAAVEIAETGREVVLVEKKPYLGGNVIKMNNYFPKLCPPYCGLEINLRRIRQNKRIRYIASAEVESITGSRGDYKVVIKCRPEYVTDACTACGKCAEVCPEIRPDEFNHGFTSTKPIFLPHEMAFPYKYTLDDQYCSKPTCQQCAAVCEYNAINLSAVEHYLEIDTGSVILATGWTGYDASRIENLNYAQYQDVITNMEFERLMAVNGPGCGNFRRPSDGITPKHIVFVQCAGSRDENHLPYCSAVCCSASLKHALSYQERFPDTRISVFYIDLRVSGRNEDFLQKVEANKNIELIKGKVAKIERNSEGGNLVVEAEDILSGKKVKLETQLVVLATGIVPVTPGFITHKDEHGFIYDGLESGLIAVSCCTKPMDVSSSVKDATGAALKAIQIV
jgi:heterodisulfide reductase subunit A-like polyferredoxin